MRLKDSPKCGVSHDGRCERERKVLAPSGQLAEGRATGDRGFVALDLQSPPMRLRLFWEKVPGLLGKMVLIWF